MTTLPLFPDESVGKPARRGRKPKLRARLTPDGATRRIVDRLAQLQGYAGIKGVLAAWQQMALCHRTAPAWRPITFPLLGDLSGPEQFVAAYADLAEVWPHLGEHVGTVEHAVDELESWDAYLHALDADDVADACRAQLVDLGGEVYQQLRAKGDVAALGAFYTPVDLARLIAQINGPVQQGEAVVDPACGTGRMLMAGVDGLAPGVDPWSCGWFGVDLDRHALAIASLNMICAGAGPHVWLSRGNGLTTHFLMPSGHPVTFDRVLANPPFGGTRANKVMAGDLAEITEVVVDPAARRHAWTHVQLATGEAA